MGQVFVDIEVVNLVDLAMAEEGLRGRASVRAVRLRGVLADTGATTLCLPRSVVAELGLRPGQIVPVMTAAGPGERRLFRGALLRYEDREAETEVLELDDGVSALLGAVPMELI